MVQKERRRSRIREEIREEGGRKMNRRSSDGTRGGCGCMVLRTGRRGTGERNGKEDSACSVDGVTGEGSGEGEVDERLEVAGVVRGEAMRGRNSRKKGVFYNTPARGCFPMIDPSSKHE